MDRHNQTNGRNGDRSLSGAGLASDHFNFAEYEAYLFESAKAIAHELGREFPSNSLAASDQELANAWNDAFDKDDFIKTLSIAKEVFLLAYQNREKDQQQFAKAVARLGFSLTMVGNDLEGDRYLMGALAIQRRICPLGSDRGELFLNLSYVASNFNRREKFTEAQELFDELFNYCECEPGAVESAEHVLRLECEKEGESYEEQGWYCDVLTRFGHNSLALEFYPKAISAFETVVSIVEAQTGEKSVAFAAALRNLAMGRREANQGQEALTLLNKAKDILLEHATRSEVLSDVYEDLGALLFENGNFRAALQHYKSAVDLQETKGDLDILKVAELWESIGQAEFRLGDFAASERSLQNSLKIYVASPDEFQAEIINVKSELAHVAMSAERFAIAEGRFSELLALISETVGTEQLSFIRARFSFGYCCLKNENFTDALQAFNSVIDGSDGDLSRLTLFIDSLELKATCLLATGDEEEGLDLLRQAVALEETYLQQRDVKVGRAHLVLAEALLVASNVSGEEILDEALRAEEILSFAEEKDAPALAGARRVVAFCRFINGDLDEAEEYLNKAISEAGTVTDRQGRIAIAGCWQLLGSVHLRSVEKYRARAEFESAEKAFLTAFSELEAVEEEHDVPMLAVCEGMAELLSLSVSLGLDDRSAEVEVWRKRAAAIEAIQELNNAEVATDDGEENT